VCDLKTAFVLELVQAVHNPPLVFSPQMAALCQHLEAHGSPQMAALCHRLKAHGNGSSLTAKHLAQVRAGRLASWTTRASMMSCSTLCLAWASRLPQNKETLNEFNHAWVT
jgi:hypothetical protein